MPTRGHVAPSNGICVDHCSGRGMYLPNFLIIASISSGTRGGSGSSLSSSYLWSHLLLLSTCQSEAAPILCYTVDSVFQPPIFTI